MVTCLLFPFDSALGKVVDARPATLGPAGPSSLPPDSVPAILFHSLSKEKKVPPPRNSLSKSALAWDFPGDLLPRPGLLQQVSTSYFFRGDPSDISWNLLPLLK